MKESSPWRCVERIAGVLGGALLVSVALSCSGKDASGPEPAHVDCEDIAVDDCEGHDDCWVLHAWPLKEDGMGAWCADFDTEEALACMSPVSALIGAPAQTWYVASPEEPSTCWATSLSVFAPRDWVACPSSQRQARFCE